ncbi:MAG: hypothetical protein EKK64_02535 [Neisseriaceae bacterium]|nr:MAG: hypothetical protein EKK64_02535 [Neisseriaceae bacterium]
MKERFAISSADMTKLITFDTRFEESYKRSNDAPTQPLEEGKFAGDNKRKNPFTFDVIASKCQALNSDSDIQKTMDELDRLANAPDFVILNSKYKVYKDITLLNWEYINSSEEHGLEVKLSFKEVPTVSRQYSSNGNMAKAKNKPTVNRGMQQAKTATPSQKEQTLSLISRTTGGWKL